MVKQILIILFLLIPSYLSAAAAKESELSFKDLDIVEKIETDEEITYSTRLANGNWLFCTKFLQEPHKNKIVCKLDTVNELGDITSEVIVPCKYYKMLIQKFLENENKAYRIRRDSMDKKEEKKGN